MSHNLKFQMIYEQRKSNFQTVVKSGNLIFNCDKKNKNKNKKSICCDNERF